MDQQRGIVFRSRTGIALTVVVWAIAAAGIVSAIAIGAGPVPLVLLASLAWFVWLVFWRPCVVVEPDVVQLRNLVRDVDIPFDAIDDLDTRFALTIAAGGQSYSAWAAPAPGGTSTLRDQMSRRRATNPDRWRDAPRSVRESGSARPGDAVGSASGAPATVIRRELERRAREGVRRAADAVVTVRVQWTLVAISVALLAASVVAIAAGAG